MDSSVIVSEEIDEVTEEIDGSTENIDENENTISVAQRYLNGEHMSPDEIRFAMIQLLYKLLQ